MYIIIIVTRRVQRNPNKPVVEQEQALWGGGESKN
jgi:hypothetical protein